MLINSIFSFSYNVFKSFLSVDPFLAKVLWLRREWKTTTTTTTATTKKQQTVLFRFSFIISFQDNTLHSSKFKAFTDDNLSVGQMMEFVFKKSICKFYFYI